MSQSVWVFHGEGARFAGGVFSEREHAEAWIRKHLLTGMLTRYPLDTGVYDWAVESELFRITKEKHGTPHFIGMFSSAHQEHYHYEKGKPDR